MGLEVTRICIVLLLVTVLYFVWMDVALYYKLQSDPNNLLVTQNYMEAQIKLAKKANNVNHTTSSSATSTTTVSFNKAFDPFNPISVKLLVLDHINHYIYYPLSSWLDSDILHISEKWIYITPDMISWTHVCVSVSAARLLVSEAVEYRRLGVLLFEIRSFLDSMDGFVARTRAKQRAMVQDSSTWGYWMDGLCDLLGTIFFMIAVLTICKRGMPRKVVNFTLKPVISNWLPMVTQTSTSEPDQEPFLPTMSTKTNNNNYRVMSFKQSTITVMCLSWMLFIASYFWNRYMEQYHLLLEVPMASESASGSAQELQTDTLRSAAFWIIAWSWRLLNPHALMSILLAAIFFDRAIDVFSWLQYLGFLPLFGLMVSSEVHLQTTVWRLWYHSH